MNKTRHSIPGYQKVIILCLAIALSGTVSGYQMSERSYQAVSACYTDYFIQGYGNVPVYSPDGTVTQAGVIESLPDEKALWDWRYEMEQITNSTRTGMQEYYFPNGPVISYGYDLLGTICVGIWEEADITRRTRDDIYAVIDAEAKTRGIEGVPVIFISESIIDTRPLRIPDPNETAFLRPLYEVANGYPPVHIYNQEKQFPSGFPHSSVSFLIETITPGYWYG
ncbi:hypothetical protein [Methanogenium organophilum]|uniref:Uncharacterized protein n=1 Tax=Methanogenium organophilum TaxID=2199 RepID=A0A9X9T964_METOG|nr:hypothetical protein [Methanogenium organophilum]WAI01827.1 hypothetical protein OU421_02840 [Methanogenium organophilum]